MSEKIATIIGSTGMIGSYLLELLLNDSYYTTVRTLVRKPQQINHAKLDEKLVNFDDEEWLKLALDGSYAVFSAIGSTLKNVKGDKDLYWKIDHDIPVRASRLAKETGTKKFLLVSSIGAHSHSSNFYLKMKGATEKDVISSGISQIHMMRPSLLLGNRKENRTAEKISQILMKPMSTLLFSSLAKYKAIEGKDVAKAMIAASKKDENGVFIYSYKEIMALANSL